MSNATQTNIPVGRRLLERVMFSTVTTVPCCVFLFINVTMLFTLRSKVVFRETSRYILLFNLLLADTVQMALSQLLYMLAACRLRLTYPACGVLTVLSGLITIISPLTLVAMSLERFVAVCYPLRHATIITVRNTGLAVVVVWSFSSLNALTRVVLLLDFPFEDLQSLQMKEFCAQENMMIGSMSKNFDDAYKYFLFTSAGVAVISSYIGVMAAARSASTDKASAQKARNTLLLHLVQLGLSLSSTVHNSMLTAISKAVDWITLVRIQIVLYLCVVVFPRCLSSLIYGIRDQTIRPVFLCHLCCQMKLTAIQGKSQFSPQI